MPIRFQKLIDKKLSGGNLVKLEQRLKAETKKRIQSFAPSAMEMLLTYSWPGNVRELSNAIERAVILCDGNEITPELLAIDHRVTSRSTAADLNDKLSLEEYFRVFVLEHQDSMSETELAQKLESSAPN